MIDRHPMIARPVPVRWAGWESDTYRLQQAGWECCVEEHLPTMSCRMVVRNREHGLIGQSADLDYRRLLIDPRNGWDLPELPVWQMRHMGSSIMVSSSMDISRFRPVDMHPMTYKESWKSLEDCLPWTDAPLVRTQALILPEATVDDLLAGILDRQQGAKTAYFKDMVDKEKRLPTHKIHAQIISLAA